jgi:hypothetical protein
MYIVQYSASMQIGLYLEIIKAMLLFGRDQMKRHHISNLQVMDITRKLVVLR